MGLLVSCVASIVAISIPEDRSKMGKIYEINIRFQGLPIS